MLAPRVHAESSTDSGLEPTVLCTKANCVLSWLPGCTRAERLCFAGRACSGSAAQRSSSWRWPGRRKGNWTECRVCTAAWPLTAGVTWTACSAVCAWPLQMSRRRWCGQRAPAEAQTWLETVGTSMCLLTLSANNPTSFSGRIMTSGAHRNQGVYDEATLTQHGLSWRIFCHEGVLPETCSEPAPQPPVITGVALWVCPLPSNEPWKLTSSPPHPGQGH